MPSLRKLKGGGRREEGGNLKNGLVKSTGGAVREKAKKEKQRHGRS